MAELGVIASGIGIASLVLQVGDSILKLKKVWDSIKEAPDEIRYLIDEIEILHLVLSDLSARNAQVGVQSGPAARSLDLCLKGARILGDLTDHLCKEIEKKGKWASVKATLKKEAIEALRQKLGRAQLMLVLSNQMYSDTVQQQRHEIQLHLMAAQEAELCRLRTAYSESEYAFSGATRYERSRNALRSQSEDKRLAEPSKIRQKERLFRLRTPAWLSSRSLEFCSYWATSGWTFHLRTYKLLPRQSLAFTHVRNGDLERLRILFAAKEASPFDISREDIEDPSENTLLALAICRSDVKICRFLVEQGADPNFSPDRYNVTPLETAMSNVAFMPGSRANHEQFDTMLRILVERADLGMASYLKPFFRGSHQTLRWLLQDLDWDYAQKTRSERLSNAFELAWMPAQWDRPQLIRTALWGQPIDSAIATAKDGSNMGLINYVAAGISEVLDEMFPGYDYTNVSPYFLDNGNVRFRCQKSGAEYIEETLLDDNLTLIRELLVAGADLSPVTSTYRITETSLRHALGKDRFFYYTPSSNAQLLAKKVLTLRIWLYQLYQSGIDLLAYGETEHQAFCNGTYVRPFSSTWKLLDWMPREWDLIWRHSTLRLISFSFGTCPDDWKFNWTEPLMNEWSRQFWEMVDHPEWAMPGAWDE